jgi:hypothetical protein
LLGTLSVQSVHDYHPFALEDMAVEVVDIAWLFWWHFAASITWVLLALVLCAMAFMSVCSISFGELLMFLSGVSWGCAARVHATSFCCS